MVILTAKLSKSKLIAIAAAAVCLLLLIIFLANRGTGTSFETASGTKLATDADRVEFLSSCGYQVSPEPVRTQEVLIPREFSEVYEMYAKLQSAQGFQLEKYKGKKVMQYVYLVESWPEGGEEPVYASILLYKNKLIAGEITRNGEDGFMRPLLSV